MANEAISKFKSEFGQEPMFESWAPGRVNLIGEHTDYNDGFVFPAAIDRGIRVWSRITDGPTRVVSSTLGSAEPFDCNQVDKSDLTGWAKYVAGVAWVVREQGKLPNIEAFIESDLPVASGLSSSAALELAFATLWNEISGFGISKQQLALKCQRAENEFVGVNCGSMDQLASALGQESHALFIDTRSLEVTPVPIPSSISLVVCDTGVKRGLVDSAYNERRSECNQACAILEKPSLREVTVNELECKKSDLGDLLYRRALHVVTENQRCLDFAEALKSNDLSSMGKLLAQSHESLRNNYEVSIFQLNVMNDKITSIDGCIGARMTGAGFGGACIALVETEKVENFMNLAEHYYLESVTAFKPSFLSCKASNGAQTKAVSTGETDFLKNSGHDHIIFANDYGKTLLGGEQS